MYQKSLEDKIKDLAGKQAESEKARAELGQILANLPISGYGRLEYYEEEWGVEVHWHTPQNEIFFAHSCVPHSCDADCDSFCDLAWDYEPLRTQWLIRAIFELFNARIEELEKGTEILNAARAMFQPPKAGIGPLKAAVRAYEEDK